MALRKIFMEGEPVLRKKSKPVEVFDEKLCELLQDLKETMRKEGGVGIAAPQVGILRRVVFIEIKEDNVLFEMVNPKILSGEGDQYGLEGCLSVDHRKDCKIHRFQKVTFEAYDRNGKRYVASAEGYAARAVQHELDHLDGILFIDRKEEKGK